MTLPLSDKEMRRYRARMERCRNKHEALLAMGFMKATTRLLVHMAEHMKLDKEEEEYIR